MKNKDIFIHTVPSKKTYIIILLYLCFSLSSQLEINLTLSNVKSFKNRKLVFHFAQNITNSLLKSGIDGEITVVDQNLFTIEIFAGTPGQNFNLLFDTGSPIIWFPKLGSIDHAQIEHHFQPDKSTSYSNLGEETSLSYGSGSVRGMLSTEKFKFFKTDIENMGFLLALETQFNVTDADGIFGFGREYGNKWKKFSILDVLYQYGIISNRLFGVKRQGTSSILSFGDLPSAFNKKDKTIANCGFRDGTDIDLRNFWTCRLSHIVIGSNTKKEFDNEANSTYTDVIFDTGTNFIVFPEELYDKFKYKFPPDYCFELIDQSQTKTFACSDISQFQKFGFVFNGYILTFEPKEIFTERILPGGSIFYVFKIYFSLVNPFIIFGMPFFEKYYSIFDLDNKEMKFISYQGDSIVDVRSKTSDSDNFWKEHAWLIVMIIILCIIVFVAIVLFIYKKFFKKSLTEQGILYKDITRMEEGLMQTTK